MWVAPGIGLYPEREESGHNRTHLPAPLPVRGGIPHFTQAVETLDQGHREDGEPGIQ